MPEGYMQLQYQRDAVTQAQKILKAYGRVFISDVVGLGKTYICAMLAKSLKNKRKLIICPPVLVDYWKRVLEEFDVAARVESLGKLDRLLEDEKELAKYDYVFIDEAHRFRNQDTESFSNVYRLKTGLLSSEGFSDEDADILASCFTPEPWGSGTKSFIRDLFDHCKKQPDKNFFDDYLEPLFYEALRLNRGESQYYKRFNCKIPFLNGGLFDPLENYDWKHISFDIPNSMFSNRDEKGERNCDGILDVFERYNFTMNEDEPLEREVAVDPEMLGKIFENLLDVTDRKSKGAYYTPREIVHYMCQESLIIYLVNEIAVPYEDVKKFILYGEIMKDEDCSKKKRTLI